MSRYRMLGMVAFLTIALASAANAELINGDFETGDLTGWNVTMTSNGQTLIQGAAMFDIDGSGPIETSYAAQFCVGKVEFSGSNGGIEMTQTMFLTAGTEYRLHYDYAAANVDANPTHYSIDGCGIYDLIVDGNSVAHGEIGELLTGETGYGALNALFVPSVSGDYTIGARITRAWKPPAPYGSQFALFQYVDNFYVPEPAALALFGLGALWCLRRR